MEFDELFVKKVGQFGISQIIYFLLLCFAIIPSSVVYMMIVFTGGVPEHWCDVPELRRHNFSEEMIRNYSIPMETTLDGTTQHSKCSMYQFDLKNKSVQDFLVSNKSQLPIVDCQQGWHYDKGTFKSTTVMEWDLVCDRQYLTAVTESVYSAGYVCGCIAFGILSDRFGRKPVAYAILLAMGILTGISPFSSSVVVFIVIKFIYSCLTLYEIVFVTVMELVGPAWRTFCGIMFSCFWALGIMLTTLLGYLIRDWKWLHYVTAAGFIPVLMYYWWIPESPRWLYSKNRQKKADAIMKKMARGKIAENEVLNITVREEEEADNKDGIIALSRNSNLRRWMLIHFLSWFTTAVVYYGLSLNIADLAGDMYVNNLISGAVEIPAYVISWFALVKVGRVYSLAVSMIVAGIMLFCVPWVPTGLSHTLGVSLAMSGKFAISAAYAIIYVHLIEMLPTSLRTTGVGVCNVMASVGGIVAPFIGDLGKYTSFPPLPMLIFGVLSVAAGTTAFFLPETRDKPLPETIQAAAQLNVKVYPKSEDLDDSTTFTTTKF